MPTLHSCDAHRDQALYYSGDTCPACASQRAAEPEEEAETLDLSPRSVEVVPGWYCQIHEVMCSPEEAICPLCYELALARQG